MAKKEISSNAKAKERHAAIAANSRKEEEEMKNKLSDDKYRNRSIVKKRKGQIRDLPKEERAAAKGELSKMIKDMKAQEAADREAYTECVKERRERERKRK